MQGDLVLISSQNAAKVNSDGSYQMLGGYNGTTGKITDLNVAANIVYLGLGSQGMALYSYHSTNISLSYTKTSLFSYKDTQQSSNFSVDEFGIDYTSGSLFVLDYTEGLLEVPLAHLQDFNKIYSPSARLLVSGCSNIVVLPLSIFVTCPELIEIDR